MNVQSWSQVLRTMIFGATCPISRFCEVLCDYFKKFSHSENVISILCFCNHVLASGIGSFLRQTLNGHVKRFLLWQTG